jgi:hypothetical protein
MDIGELAIKLRVIGDKVEALDKFKKDIGTASTSIGKFGNFIFSAKTQVIAFASALTYLSKKASDVALSLNRFSLNTGLSTQKLQQWQQMAAASGVSAEELQNSIEAISDAGAEARLTGVQPPWLLVGIDPRQNPFTVFDQLRKKISAFGPAMGTKLYENLGMSKQMISFFREIHRLGPMDKTLLLSKDEEKRLKDFNILYNKTFNTFKLSLQKLGAAMAPIASIIIKAFDRGIGMVRWFGQGIDFLDTHLENFKKTLMALGLIMAIAFFPMQTAVVGLLLLLDDLRAYVQGDNSVIGLLVKSLQNMGKDSFTGTIFGKTLGSLDFATQGPLGVTSKQIDRANNFNVTNNITQHNGGSNDPEKNAQAIKDGTADAIGSSIADHTLGHRPMLGF